MTSSSTDSRPLTCSTSLDPNTPRPPRPKPRPFPSSPALMTISPIRLALSSDSNLDLAVSPEPSTGPRDIPSPIASTESKGYHTRAAGRPPLSPRTTSLVQSGTRYQERSLGFDFGNRLKEEQDSFHQRSYAFKEDVPHRSNHRTITLKAGRASNVTIPSPIHELYAQSSINRSSRSSSLSPLTSLPESSTTSTRPRRSSSSSSDQNAAIARRARVGPMIPTRESSRRLEGDEQFGMVGESNKIDSLSRDRDKNAGMMDGKRFGSTGTTGRPARSGNGGHHRNRSFDPNGASTEMMDTLIAQLNSRSSNGSRSWSHGERRREGGGTRRRTGNLGAEERVLMSPVKEGETRARSGTITHDPGTNDVVAAAEQGRIIRFGSNTGELSDESEEGPVSIEKERQRRRIRRAELGRRAPPERNYGRTQAVPISRKDGLPTKEELKSIADELRGPVPAPTAGTRPEKSSMMSIEDIIKKHSAATPQAFGPRKGNDGARSRTAPPVESTTDGSSMSDMLQQSNALLRKLSDGRTAIVTRRTSVATNSTARGTTKARSAGSGRSVASLESGGGASGTTAPIMEYLRSQRLNRLITLQRSNQAGQVVSLADVGNANGYPVLVFFGLGCVRYLIALFDELAETLNLRLICIDRWGLGKSTDVPAEQRGLLEWANVVDEVMDQLKIRKFGILAHSAGAPYALAVAYKLEQRISGKVHLLAPWVNADIDGGYKWLKYVPTGVLKTAQATEWKVHGWMLGRLPKLQSEGIGHDAQAPSGFDSRSGIVKLGGQSSWMDEEEEEERVSPADVGQSLMDRTFESGSSLTSWAEVDTEEVILSPKPERHPGGAFLGGMFSAVSKLSSAPSMVLAPPVTNTFSRTNSRTSEETASTGRPSLDAPSRIGRPAISPFDRPPSIAEHNPIETSLVTSLLQASHAEALTGGTSEFLAIMGRDSKPWGFAYEDVDVACKVWYGEKDDKISEKSVRWMEREMRDVELRVVKGEGHDLLTSGRVMVEVLESLAGDAVVAARSGRGEGRLREDGR